MVEGCGLGSLGQSRHFADHVVELVGRRVILVYRRVEEVLSRALEVVFLLQRAEEALLGAEVRYYTRMSANMTRHWEG